MPECVACDLQLMIYGTDGPFVPNENLQNTNVPGAIHNITNYLITYLVPGVPSFLSVPSSLLCKAAMELQQSLMLSTEVF